MSDYGPRGCCGPEVAILAVAVVAGLVWPVLLLGLASWLVLRRLSVRTGRQRGSF